MKPPWEYFEELNEIVYVCDLETHDLIYMNQYAKKLFSIVSPEDYVGKKCYVLLQGLQDICPFCSNENLEEYYIANITRVVDALCLEKSLYFETEIPSIGTIYTVSKYCIYDERTENSDIFKLANRQEIPIFVSERFKKIIEEEKITGICLQEIKVV